MRSHSKSRWAMLSMAALLSLMPTGTADARHRRRSFPTFTKLIIDPDPGDVPVEKLMADLNGDGKLDIIIGLENAGLYWWGFPASGVITDPWQKHTIHSTGNFYEDLQAYDLNGDGHLDIIACHDNTMYWYANPGGDATGTWNEHLIGSGLGHNVLLADIDGDGKIDVVTQYGVYFQNTPDDWTFITLGDLKGLALLDIGSGMGAINPVLNTASGVTWYENPREHGGNARTDAWAAHLIDGSTGSTEAPLASGFITQSGRMQVLGNPDGQGLVWWEAPGDRRNGTWIKHSIPSQSPLGDYQDIHRICVADMDNNGTLDLVVAEQEQSHDPVGGPYSFTNDRVTVFFNDGNGNFSEDILETTGGQNNCVGDVDGDGDLDILNVNHGFYGAPHPIELFVNNLISSGGGGGGGGSLSGTTDAAQPSYDLTALGTSDWVHWGRGGAYGTLDRKASGGGQISDVSIVGSGANSGGWSDGSRGVTWSDGTPTPSGADDGYIWSNGSLGTGFSFTVPADTTGRTLLVYTGESNATGTLTAHLSDGSAPDYSVSQTGPGASITTIHYASGSDGQFMTLTLRKTGNNSGFTDGSADLIAAMLEIDGSSGGASGSGGSGSGGGAGAGSGSGGGAGSGAGAASASTGAGGGHGGCGLLGLEAALLLVVSALRRRN